MTQSAFRQIMARDLDGSLIPITVAFSLTADYNVGQEVIDENGNHYSYCKTANNETITQYDAVILLHAGIEQIDSTNAADTAGGGVPVGVAMGAAVGVSGTPKYGWVCIKTGFGQTQTMTCGASCAAYVGLQTTATSGQLDDATAGEDIHRLVITADLGTGATQGLAILNYPFVLETFA